MRILKNGANCWQFVELALSTENGSKIRKISSGKLLQLSLIEYVISVNKRKEI